MLTLADVLPDLATMEEDCELRDAAAQLRQLLPPCRSASSRF